MGAASSGCRRRSCLHCTSFSADRKLFHRLDDAAGVLHRVPVGSGRSRQTCGVHFPIAEFVRVVPGGGAARFPAAAATRHPADRFSRVAELPGHSTER